MSVQISTSRDSRCFMVRSSGVTPIAVTQSIPEMKILSRSAPVPRSLVRLIQPLPAGEAGLDVMPVLDGLFTKLPTQVNQAALPHVGKITEALIDILEHDTHFLDLVNQEHQVRNGLHVGHTGFAEAIVRRLVAGFLDFRMELLDPIPLPID